MHAAYGAVISFAMRRTGKRDIPRMRRLSSEAALKPFWSALESRLTREDGFLHWGVISQPPAFMTKVTITAEGLKKKRKRNALRGDSNDNFEFLLDDLVGAH
jgi:hypothetical protein